MSVSRTTGHHGTKANFGQKVGHESIADHQSSWHYDILANISDPRHTLTVEARKEGQVRRWQ